MKRLIERAQQGDREAQNTLVAVLKPTIVTSVRSSLATDLRRRLDQDDLIQEVHVQILAGLKKFDYRSDPQTRTWVREVATSKIREIVERERAQMRNPKKENYEVDVAGMRHEHSSKSEVTEAVMNRETNRLVEDAIGRLAPDRAELIRLVYLEGHSIVSVARRFKVPASTARYRLLDARTSLASILGSEFKHRGRGS